MDRIKKVEGNLREYKQAQIGELEYFVSIGDIEYLLADNKRLREALQKIYDGCNYEFLEISDYQKCGDTANEALIEEGN